MGTQLRHLLALEIDRARVHAGVSFAELADRSGIAADALGELLDEKQDFTVVDLVRIAAVFEVPVTALLPGTASDGS